eukprot:3555647-Rhodomonas_salina.1
MAFETKAGVRVRVRRKAGCGCPPEGTPLVFLHPTPHCASPSAASARSASPMRRVALASAAWQQPTACVCAAPYAPGEQVSVIVFPPRIQGHCSRVAGGGVIDGWRIALCQRRLVLSVGYRPQSAWRRQARGSVRMGLGSHQQEPGGMPGLGVRQDTTWVYEMMVQPGPPLRTLPDSLAETGLPSHAGPVRLTAVTAHAAHTALSQPPPLPATRHHTARSPPNLLRPAATCGGAGQVGVGGSLGLATTNCAET